MGGAQVRHLIEFAFHLQLCLLAKYAVAVKNLYLDQPRKTHEKPVKSIHIVVSIFNHKHTMHCSSTILTVTMGCSLGAHGYQAKLAAAVAIGMEWRSVRAFRASLGRHQVYLRRRRWRLVYNPTISSPALDLQGIRGDLGDKWIALRQLQSLFEDMNLSVDEAEHSMEMHLPYLAKVFRGGRTSVKIVPIMVGACSPETEATYGRILAKYIDDPTYFFSISSNFCH